MRSLQEDEQQRISTDAGAGPWRLAAADVRPWCVLAAASFAVGVTAELAGALEGVVAVAAATAALAGVIQALRIFKRRRSLLIGALQEVWAVGPKGLPWFLGWPRPGKQLWVETGVVAPGVGDEVLFTLRAGYDRWGDEERIFLTLYDPQGQEVAASAE